MSIVADVLPVFRHTVRLGLDPSRGYPRTAAEMERAFGGTWTGGFGWLCDETSGGLVPAFGGTTLPAASTPTYSHQGPRGAVDRAVGLDSDLDGFGGVDILDVGASDDLMIVWVGMFTGVPENFRAVVSKGAGTDGWIVYHNAGALKMEGSASSAGVATLPAVNVPFAGALVISRGESKQRLGVRSFVGDASIGAEGATQASYTSASNFYFGGGGGWLASGAIPFQLAALYGVTGVGVAADRSANLSAALASFVAAVAP